MRRRCSVVGMAQRAGVGTAVSLRKVTLAW